MSVREQSTKLPCRDYEERENNEEAKRLHHQSLGMRVQRLSKLEGQRLSFFMSFLFLKIIGLDVGEGRHLIFSYFKRIPILHQCRYRESTLKEKCVWMYSSLRSKPAFGEYDGEISKLGLRTSREKLDCEPHYCNKWVCFRFESDSKSSQCTERSR